MSRSLAILITVSGALHLWAGYGLPWPLEWQPWWGPVGWTQFVLGGHMLGWWRR